MHMEGHDAGGGLSSPARVQDAEPDNGVIHRPCDGENAQRQKRQGEQERHGGAHTNDTIPSVLHTPGETVRFTRAGVRALDQAAIEDLGIPGVVLMENASVALRQAALESIRARGLRQCVLCCGPGNNGGDGLALARHLHNQGIALRGLLAADEHKFQGDAATQLNIAHRMGLSIESWSPGAAIDDPARALVVDALLGTGLDRALGGTIGACAAWINLQASQGAFVLSVDIPTGLDADTGKPLGGVCVRADRTVTLAGPKVGMTEPGAAAWCGEVLVGDIGVPPGLLRRFGVDPGGRETG